MALSLTTKVLLRDFIVGFLLYCAWRLCVYTCGGNGDSPRMKYVIGPIILVPIGIFIDVYFDTFKESIEMLTTLVEFTVPIVENLIDSLTLMPMYFDGFTIVWAIVLSVVPRIGEEDYRPKFKCFMVSMILVALIRSLICACSVGKERCSSRIGPVYASPFSDNDCMIANHSCTEFCVEVVTKFHDRMTEMQGKDMSVITKEQTLPLENTLESDCALRCITYKESLGEYKFVMDFLDLYKPGGRYRKT